MMTEKEKEFEIQKALGLAFECNLTITTLLTPQIDIQKIKDAVEKHTFTSKCIKEEAYSYPAFTEHSEAKLKFEVKCVDNIIERLSTELRPYSVEILISFKTSYDNCRFIESEYLSNI